MDCLSCTESEKQTANLSAKTYWNSRFYINPLSGTPNTSSFDESE